MEEALRVPGGVCWQVAVVPGEPTALASEANAVLLTLSTTDRARLAAPEAEGVYFRSTEGLRCAVEKDFPCAHPRGAEVREPVTETFQPPPDFERRKNEPGLNGD